MGIRITKYKTEISEERIPYLVKEKALNYETDNLLMPSKVFQMLNSVFRHGYQTEEVVYMLCYNLAGKLMGIFELSRGSVEISILSIKSIVTKMLLCGAVSCVVAHNHPGGSIIPSGTDNDTKEKLKNALSMMELTLLDFMIITNVGYYSYRERNLL